MSEHAQAAARLLEDADLTDDKGEAIAVLEVGEQAEYAGEQLRRIADSLDRLVEHLTAVPACEGCEHPGHPGKACATEVPAGDRPPGIYRCGCRWLAG